MDKRPLCFWRYHHVGAEHRASEPSFIQIGYLQGRTFLDSTVYSLVYIPTVLDAALLTAVVS